MTRPDLTRPPMTSLPALSLAMPAAASEHAGAVVFTRPLAYASGQGADKANRRRAAALSLAMLLLGAAALYNMGYISLDGLSGHGANLVSISLEHGDKAQKAAKAAPAASARPRAAPVPTPPQPAVPAPPTPRIAIAKPQAAPVTGGFLHLSHDDLAAADIGKMSRHISDGNGEGDSNSAPSSYGPGEGPGGAQLFNAAWYREPADAELRPYLTHGAPSGSWAEIACKTVPHYHVEDCRELNESPPGSGLARALRQAAWQFLVRPPRRNGEALMGAWVRIRFDWVRRGGDAGQDDPR